MPKEADNFNFNRAPWDSFLPLKHKITMKMTRWLKETELVAEKVLEMLLSFDDCCIVAEEYFLEQINIFTQIFLVVFTA